MPTVNEITAAVDTASRTADKFISQAEIGLREIKLNMANILQYVPTIQNVAIDYSPPTLNTGNAPVTPTPPIIPSVPDLPTTGSVTLANLTEPVAITMPVRPVSQDITLDVNALLSSLPQHSSGITPPQTTPVAIPPAPVLSGTGALVSAIANEPVLADYTPPTKPILDVIADPVFKDYVDVTPFTPTSTFVGTSLSVSTALPEEVSAELNRAFSFTPTPVDTDELEAGIRDAISRGLSGGGFATSAETEAIKAAQGRMADAIADAGERAARDLAARGFPAPSGLLLAASRRAANDARRDFAQTYATIVAEESRMNRDDVRTAIASGTAFIDMLNKYHMAIVELSYKVAVTTAEFQFRLFDMVVNLAKARDDFEQVRLGYAKAELDYNAQQLQAWLAQYEANRNIAAVNDNIYKVYEAQQRVQALKADLFSTEVNLFKSQVDTNAMLLDQYKSVISAKAAVLDGDRLVLDLYKAQLSGVGAVQQSDKLALDVYRAGLEADKLNVDKTIAIIDANVKAELAKADINKAQISAYVAEVGAEEAKARIAGERDKAVLRANEQAIQSQKLTAEVARLTLLAHEAEVANLLSEYKVSTSVYATALQEASRLDTLALNNHRLVLEHAKANADITLQSSIANVERALKMGDLSVGAFKASTEIAARVASSAMSAHNTVLELSGKVFS